MRNALPTSMIGVVALLAFSSLAMAQGSAPGTKESLYNGNRLKTDPTPGGHRTSPRCEWDLGGEPHT
jgi:hypothetical protein